MSLLLHGSYLITSSWSLYKARYLVYTQTSIHLPIYLQLVVEEDILPIIVVVPRKHAASADHVDSCED